MKKQRAPQTRKRGQRVKIEALNYPEAEDAYQQGYADAIEDMHRLRERRTQRHRERKARRWYFIKQKALGSALLAITALMIPVMDGDATAAVFTVPLGLYLIFTKQMCITNAYYWETKEGGMGK